MTDLVQYVSLDVVSDWVKAIENIKECENSKRKEYAVKMRKEGYAIDQVVLEFIEMIYR